MNPSRKLSKKSDIFSDFLLTGALDHNIYSFIFQDDRYFNSLKMSPSEFRKEMAYSTEERMEKLINNKKDLKRAKLNKIEISPQFVIFQNIQNNLCNCSSSVQFAIINYTEKLAMFKVLFEKNETFDLQPKVNFIRLAPGMRLTFTIIFTPSVYQDYLHKVVFETSKDKITIPIICIGPRPMIDFPDNIDLPTTPVKKESSLKVCIKNIGIVPTSFKLFTKKPFSVHPESGELSPNDFLEITIKFKPFISGPICENVVISLITGEQLETRLQGVSKLVDVRLSRNEVVIPRAFIGLPTFVTINIKNTAMDRLDFSWMKNASHEEDSTKTFESFEDFKEKEYGIHGDATGDQGDNTFNEDLQLLYQYKPFAFHDKYFDVFPTSEDVWPYTEKEIIISFKSNTAGEFSAKAFCNIVGREDRIPLTMRAICLGPQIKFDIHQLNVDLCFANEHVVDLILRNKGGIVGKINFKPQTSNFGIKIQCVPTTLCLKPDSSSVFTISLLAFTPGPYIEDLVFEIEDSLQIVKVTVKGNVNSPSLKLEPHIIDFGAVPIGKINLFFSSLVYDCLNLHQSMDGFEQIKYLKIQNISQAILEINFKIPTDGVISPSINVLNFIQTQEKPKLPTLPREFTIKPSSCRIAPTEEKLIKVKLVAGGQRTQETVLEGCLQNSEINPIVIPLTFNARYPTIISQSPKITMDECFINHKNLTVLTVLNASKVRGYYYPVKKVKGDVLWDLVPSEAIIESEQSFEIGLLLHTQSVGPKSLQISFQLFGDPCPMFLSQVDLIGVGPKISSSPENLHWGEVCVLQTTTKCLTLLNKCPIEALFNCRFNNSNSSWSVDQLDGVVPAEDNLTLTVSLTLKDAGLLYDKLIISIQHSKDIVIPLSAKGVSTSIVINPSITPILDLGYQFTHMHLKLPLDVANHGTKSHYLKWSTVNEIKRKQDDPEPHSFYHFHPQELRLIPFENMTVYVEAYSDKVQTVSEHWFVYGTVEFGKKELLLETDVKIYFIKPSVQASKPRMNFQINQGPYEKQFFVLDYIILKNTSLADLDIEISTDFPFQIVLGKTPSDVKKNRKCPCICSKMLSNIIENEANMKNVQLDMYDESEPTANEESDDEEFDINNIKDVIKKFSDFFNLVQKQPFTLVVGEEIYVNILFNGSFGQNYRPEKFKGVLNIAFNGHPKKDKIPLIGEINYPDVVFTPINLNLEAIPNSNASAFVMIENVTPLTVKYQLKWDNVFIQPLEYSQPESAETYTTLSDRSSVTDMSLENWLSNQSNEQFIMGVLNKKLSKMLLIHDHEDAYHEIENILLDTILKVLEIEREKDFEYFRESLDKHLSRMLYINEHEGFLFIEELLKQNVSEVLELYASMSNIVCAEESVIGLRRASGVRSLSLHDILIITPDRGRLKPFESQKLQVYFCPTKAICIKTTVMCYPQRGPTRYFMIQADSSDIEYFIDSTILNFGICSFYENCAKKFTLSNTGRLSFDFFISESNNHELSTKSALSMSFVSLSPSEGHLVSGQSLDILVTINPGIFGWFNSCLELKVAHFNATCIQVDGWGFFPQIGFSNNFCLEGEVSHEVAYTAIGTLTDNLLNAYSVMLNCYLECAPQNTPLSEDSEDEMIQPATTYLSTLIDNGWSIVSDEGLPSVSYIDLAIERIQVYQQISPLLGVDKSLDYKNNKKFLNFHSRKKCLDFGTVVIGNSVTLVTNIVNYAPCDVHLRILKRNKLPIWISVNLPNSINCGNTSRMIVTLKMYSEFFDLKVSETFTHLINVQVDYGVIIPMEIKVVLIAPFLKTLSDPINFGTVINGDFKITSLPIVNLGVVTCNWSAYITLDSNLDKTSQRHSSPYMILNSSGTLEPEIEEWIRFSFKPSHQGNFNGKLVITTETNGNNIVLPVIGKGLNPTFDIIGENIIFNPTIPHSMPQELLFAIFNPNPFSIEVQFENANKYPENQPSGIKYFFKSIENVGSTQEFTSDDVAYTEPIDPSVWEACETLQIMPQDYEPIYLIFFGAPFTDGFNIIKRLRDRMNLTILNLDQLLMESIANEDTPASSSIRSSIAQAYAELMQKAIKNNTPMDPEPNRDSWDEMDNLDYEVQTLLTAWETNTDYMKQSKKTAGKSAKPSKKTPPDTYRSTISIKSLNLLLNIPEALLIEALQAAFANYPEGFILDNLNCKFLDTPNIAFICVLKSLEFTKHVQLIVFHNSYTDFASTVPERDPTAVDSPNYDEANNPSLVLLDAKTKFFHYARDLENLLNSVDNWDTLNNCLVPIMVSTAKPGKQLKKTASRKSKLGADTVSVMDSTIINVDLGLTSWIINSTNNYTPDIMAYNISKINPEPAYSHNVLEKPLKYALYSSLPCDDDSFIDDCPPFRICVVDRVPTRMCLCNNKLPPYKFESLKIQEFLNNAQCLCTCVVSTCSIIGDADILEDPPEYSTFPSHLKLPPYFFMKYKCVFNPRVTGVYNKKFLITPVRCSKLRQILCASGMCDIQRIDTNPLKVFSKVVSRSKHANHPLAYNISTEEFNFGPVLYTPDIEKAMKTVEWFNITNISHLPLEVMMSFQNVDDWYEVLPKHLSISPGVTKSINVSVKPNSQDIVRNTLICSIKNNPEIFKVNVVSRGVMANFSSAPDSIDFCKMLLYRQETQVVHVINSCEVPLLWRLRNLEDFSGHLVPSKLEDTVSALSAAEFKLSFIGASPTVITQKPLYIDVFGLNKQMEPVLTTSILISAECYDVVFDCIFEPPEETHVNYGNVMVGGSVVKNVAFINRGLYNLVFRIVKSDNRKGKLMNLLNNLEVSTSTGLLKPNDGPFNIEITCIIKDELTLKEHPLLNCHLIDANETQKIVAIFPIKVSIKSHYNKYILEPEGNIDFGSMVLGSRASKTFILTNIGYFDFSFDILTSFCTKKDFSSRKSGAEGRDTRKSLESMPFKKIIQINPWRGHLKPQEKAQIELTCTVDHVGYCCEDIIFKISDASAEKCQTRLTVRVEGCIPDVRFFDTSFTFQDCIIVNDLDEFKSTSEMDQHCIYVKNEECLYFMRTSINSVNSVKIYLLNKSNLTCSLSFDIGTKSSLSDSQFTVHPDQCKIKPNCKSFVTVSFVPLSIEICEAALTITIEMPGNHPPKTYTTHLIGQGIASQIMFLTSIDLDESNHGHICLRPTILNDVSICEISFRNISEVICNVTVKLSENNGPKCMFHILSERPEKDSLEQWNPEEPLLKECIKIVKQNDASKIIIHYKPCNVGIHCCEVVFEIANNPYDTYLVTIVGKSYFNNINIAGLEVESYKKIVHQPKSIVKSPRKSRLSSSVSVTSSTKSLIKRRAKVLSKCKSETSSSSKVDLTNDGQDDVIITYSMNIGYWEIDSVIQRNIEIVNHSSSEMYRFEFEPSDCVYFSPSLGHIMPNERKDIIISLNTALPVTYTKKPFICNYAVLKNYESVEKNTKGWDNRHQATVWEYDSDIRSNLRQTQPMAEPEMEVLFSLSRLIILLSCVVGAEDG